MTRALWAGLVTIAVLTLGCSPKPQPLSYTPLPPDLGAAERALPPAAASGRLPAWAVPQAYSLDLSLDPREARYLGRVRIEVRLSRQSDHILLHSAGPRVLTAAARRGDQVWWAKPRQRRAAGAAGQELVLLFDRPIAAGSLELDIEFEAPFADGLRGLYRVKNGGHFYVFSQMEPSDARRAFPCFDEPRFKTPFTVTLSVPAWHVAASNAPPKGQQEHLPSGLTSTRFAPTPPLPTYLVAMAVGPLEVHAGPEASRVPISVLAVPGKKGLSAFAAETAHAQLSLLEEYFGQPYPYAKLDLVAVPEMSAGAMENPGLVTFREELLLQNATAGVEAKRGLFGIMAHELAHQWFGNLVTPKWWNDLWLNEGLASWMGAKIANRHKPTLGIADERVAAKSAAMQLDALSSARSVRQPVRTPEDVLSSFDTITYVKGASVIGMVEAWLGEDVTRQAMRAYIARHRHDNASASDLIFALERASGKPVGSVVSSFVDQSGVPLLDMAIECSDGAAVLNVSQRELIPLGRARGQSKRWSVPVCIRAKSAKKVRRVCVLQTRPVQRHSLGLTRCPTLWAPNDAETGYYRAKLPPTAAKALARNAMVFMTARERAGWIAGNFSLVESGELSLSTHLNILRRLSTERERSVWVEIVRELGIIDFWIPSEARAGFAKFVRALLSPATRAFGTEARPGEPEDVRLLRPELWATLSRLGQDTFARAQLSKLADKWLSGSESVNADLARVALSSHARDADEALRRRLLQRLRSAKLPEARMVALAGLAGFDRPEQVTAVLAATLTDAFRLQDLRNIYAPLLRRRATAPLAAQWLQTNFDRVKPRLPGFAMRRVIASLGSLCDAELAEKVATTIGKKAAEDRAFQMQLSRAVEQAKLCAAAGQAHGGKAGELLRR